MYRGLPPNGRLLSVSLSDQKKMKIGQFSKVKVGKLEPFAKNFIDDRTKAITLNLFTVEKGTVRSARICGSSTVLIQLQDSCREDLSLRDLYLLSYLGGSNLSNKT